MQEKPPKPPLRLVDALDANPVQPPSTLGEAGRRLWNEVQREFNVEDVCGRELLAQACGAADRVESLRTQIAIAAKPSGPRPACERIRS